MSSRVSLLLGGLYAAIACAQIAGIEDAELDPELSERGGGSGEAGAPDPSGGGRAPSGGTATSGGINGTGGADAGGSAGAPELGGAAGTPETGGSAGAIEPGGAGGTAEPGGAGGTAEPGGAAGAPDAAGAGGAGEPTLCEEFCAIVQANCTGTNQVYVSEATCLRVCSFFEPGNPDEMSGPSVHCRMTNARLVTEVGEPEEHCPAAGPGGNGICGENCDNFCTIALASCIDPELGGFQERDTCIADCPEVDLGGFDVSQAAGNTMQCRLYHASAASVAPIPHCEHTQGEVGPCAP